MNPKGKKLLSLFLVFSLLMLSANLYAKEKRGAELVITKKDGQLIEGELITVKEDSILLLDAEGKDVSVGVADIRVIKIVKKSKWLLGAGIGFLVCGGAGALISILSGWTAVVEDGEGVAAFISGGVGAAAGLLIGGVVGANLGTDKTIQIEGMTDSEIQETLDKLRKKARVRDYK